MSEQGVLSWFDETLLALKCTDVGAASDDGGVATQSGDGIWSRVIDPTTGLIRVVSV